jgi:MFS family permease
MNKNLWLLGLLQGLFFTHNVTFIAINGLVGLDLAPEAWMATLPVMGYVVGGAISTGLVATSQQRYGRKISFLLGAAAAFFSALLGVWAVLHSSFILLVSATVIAGYYSANGQLYRFAASELCVSAFREKAVSLVMAGGLIGAIVGPNLALHSKNLLSLPFAGAYAALALVALFSMIGVALIEFPQVTKARAGQNTGRALGEIMREPVFLVATLSAAFGYGVMNLLMAATPLAMQVCGLSFESTAWVLQWHVIGMFAPGFFTGHLIKRFGVLTIMGVGVALNAACIAVGLSGVDLHEFLIALFLLGVGWNFLFTGSTTLAMQAYTPEEKDKAQAAINFFVFAIMAVTSFASGALVTSQGWATLNWGSLLPVVLIGSGVFWLAQNKTPAPKNV